MHVSSEKLNNSNFTSHIEETYKDAIPVDLIAVYVFLSILGTLIVAVNLVVIYLVFTREYLRTVTNYCLASLALSDMLSGLYPIPLIIACSTHYDKDICLAMDLGQRFLAISTVLHLLLITLERYFTIVFSMMHSASVLSKKTCHAALASLWLFSLIASVIQLSFIDVNSFATNPYVITYDFICLGLLAILPLVIMATAYVHIFYTLRRHCEQIKREVSHISRECTERNAKKERRAQMIYSAMVGLFLVGWFNYFINSLQEDLGNRAEIPFWADAALLLLRFSAGLLNPLLYTFLKQDFKRARRSLRLGLPCHRKRSRSALLSHRSSFSMKRAFISSNFSSEDPQQVATSPL